MEVLLSLAGVVVGWLLAVATAERRRKQEGRSAARLVMAELLYNENELGAMGSNAPAVSPIRRLAWDTYAVWLLRITDRDTVTDLIKAYYFADLAETSLKFLNQAVKEQEETILRLSERRAEAEASGQPQLAERFTQEIHERGPGLRDLESGRDDFLSEIATTYLPHVTAARKRVAKLADLR